MLQVFFQLTDKNGIIHETNAKPYEFNEVTVYAMLNSKELCYPITIRNDDNGKLIKGKMAIIENVIFDLMHEVPVLRIKLLEIDNSTNTK